MVVSWLDVDQWLWSVESEGMFYVDFNAEGNDHGWGE